MSGKTPDLLDRLIDKRWLQKHRPIEARAAEVKEWMRRRDLACKTVAAQPPGITRAWSRFLDIDIKLIEAMLSLTEAWIEAYGRLLDETEQREAQIEQIRTALSGDRAELGAAIESILAEQWPASTPTTE